MALAPPGQRNKGTGARVLRRLVLVQSSLSMPRFFFHVSNGHGGTPDESGTELDTQAAAKHLAIDSIRSMVSEDARLGVIDLNGRIDIQDDDRNVLVTIDFHEAFDIRGPRQEQP